MIAQDGRLAPLRNLTVWQGILVLAIWLYICGLHWHNNGLWYQGDSPRHAANGLFWKAYLSSRSLADPKGFALSYYARYPAICPTVYPPLFYLLEALLFSVLGPSAYVAKALVLLFSLVAALYSLAWLRRWLAPEAGWAAGLLLLQPDVLRYSHAIMLNVPALALDLAALYHARRGLEATTSTHYSRHWYAAALLSVIAVLTYPTAGVVVFVIVAWLVASGRGRLIWHPQSLLLVGLSALVLLPWTYVVVHWAPKQLSWVVPTVARTLRSTTWVFYAACLTDILQPSILVLAALGAAGGLACRRWRRETTLLLLWACVCYVVFSLFRAKESRYLLLVSVPVLCLSLLALLLVSEGLERARASWRAGRVLQALVAVLLLAQGGLAARVRVPEIRGYRSLVAQVGEIVPEGPVLYDGPHDGLFTFYLQAGDPGYHRQVVRGDKLLAAAASPQDVIDILRIWGGCRWLLVEVEQDPEADLPARLLREVVQGPEFQRIRSFPLHSGGVERVDLYQLMIPIGTPAAASLPLLRENITPIRH
jgi:hypothetical protein